MRPGMLNPQSRPKPRPLFSEWGPKKKIPKGRLEKTKRSLIPITSNVKGEE